MYRILAFFGLLAHSVNVALRERGRSAKRSDTPRVGIARIAWCLAAVGIAVVVAGWATVNAAEGNANTSPTSYSVDQLVANPNVGDKVYATVTGYIHDWYVEQDKGSTKAFDKAWYLIGSTNGDAWIIVESGKAEAQVNDLIDDSGKVTFTGMLRTDHGEVEDAIKTLGDNVPSVNISTAILLKDGETPANPTVMYVVAAVATALGLLLLIGWGIGYMVFRPDAQVAPVLAGGFEGAMPVRVTGLIPGYFGGRRALEDKAELRASLSETGMPVTDLVWQSDAVLNGIRLNQGTSAVSPGTAYPISGKKPALRIVFMKKKLTLSFDSEQARDQAFAQVRASAGPATS